MKKLWKKTIKILLIFTVLILPFIYITEIISIDTFLDSFENPKHYMCIQSEGLIFGSKSENTNLLIIQKSSHPDFSLNKNDYIIYFIEKEFVNCNKIIHISNEVLKTKYYIKYSENLLNYPIFEEQIIGKVIKVIDDNILNSISIKIWEASINNLNIRALTN